MKNLFILLIIFSFFMIGCQENSITDPVTNDDANKILFGDPEEILQGVIQLDRVLNDPYPIGNSFYKIIGQLNYTFRKIDLNSDALSEKPHNILHLQIDADMHYICTVCQPSPEDNLAGYLSEEDDSYVEFVENTTFILHKTYCICGREDKMELHLQLTVSEKEVELNKMWLALPNEDAIHTKNISINNTRRIK